MVSAHPDDESLGCGGTLLKHIAGGDQVHWIIATQAWAPKWTDEYKQSVLAESERVAERIAPRRTRRLNLPAARLDDIALIEIIDPLAAAISDIRPTIVYSVGPHDVMSDHRIVFRSLEIALKPVYASSLRRWLTYELPGSTDWSVLPEAGPFRPTVFTDISDVIEQKLALVALYRTEMRNPPHPRSADGVRALARTRGLSVGLEYAEAFELCREIIR